jgi:hypothetical protein
MKLMKHTIRGLCLAGLCITSVLAFGMTGTASATILFLPLTHTYPYHLAGLHKAKSVLETVGGTGVESESLHVLVLVLSPTLADVHIRFLQSRTVGLGERCWSPSEGEASQIILVSLLAHLGLADPGRVPAVLMLVPRGFEFKCRVLGAETGIQVRGLVIGTLTHPGLGVCTLLLGILFNQSRGRQDFTTFLLGNETITNAFEESRVGTGSFEQSGQSTSLPVLLHALPGEPGFFLLLP